VLWLQDVPPRELRKVNRSILVQHMSRYSRAEADRQVLLACSFMQKEQAIIRLIGLPLHATCCSNIVWVDYLGCFRGP